MTPLVRCFFILLLIISAKDCLAATESNSLTISSGETRDSQSKLFQNKSFPENKEITDARLKAEAGSLSRYSLKFNLSYSGPTLGDVSAKDQPNPDGTVGSYETALGGVIGIRYRTSSHTSFSFGTGLKAIHPLHGMERFDLQTPYLNYDMTSKAYGLQIRHSPGISVTTVPNFLRVGQAGSISYDFASIYDIAESRYAVGLDANLSLLLYNREYRVADRKASRSLILLSPTIKYQMTDKASLLGALILVWASPRSAENDTVFLNRTPKQRLGLGYAFSRDIYLFPFLNLYPSNLSVDSTTINISTTFSLM